MSKKKIIILVILAILAFGIWYGYNEFTRTNKDLSKVKADVTTGAMDLIKEYESNDSAANKKYLGMVVEVNGTVKQVVKDDSGYYTVILGDTANMSSIRCALDTSHQADAASLKVGSSVILRGNCTGYQKDETGMGIGSDVILNRSVIVSGKQ